MEANEYPSNVGTGAAFVRSPAILRWRRQAVRGRAVDPFWERPALFGSALLAAALYLLNLTVSGYANTYYAAAALAAGRSTTSQGHHQRA